MAQVRPLSQTWLGGEKKTIETKGREFDRHFPGSLGIFLGPCLLIHIWIFRVPPLSVSTVIHKQPLNEALWLTSLLSAWDFDFHWWVV